METKFDKTTDTEHRIKLDSYLISAQWRNTTAVLGQESFVDVLTAFVGHGSEITVDIKTTSGKTLGKIKGKVRNNRYLGSFEIPKNLALDDLVYFTLTLPQNGLSGESNPIPVSAPIEITKMQWESKIARRGDVIGIHVAFGKMKNGTPAKISIYEFDSDKIHDKIVDLPVEIKNNKIETIWRFRPSACPSTIATDEELRKFGKRYEAPKYFFVVDINGNKFGQQQQSGFLVFQDWLDLKLLDHSGSPIAGEEYNLRLPDGSIQHGRLDGKGCAKLEKIPPGSCRIEFPGYQDVFLQDRLPRKSAQANAVGIISGTQNSLVAQVRCFPGQLSIACAHSDGRPDLQKLPTDWYLHKALQVVAGIKKGDTITISFDGRFCEAHPVIHLDSLNEPVPVKNKKASFDVKSLPPATKAGFFKELFYPRQTPNKYGVSVETCGKTTNLKIDAFYEAQYEFEFLHRSLISYSDSKEPTEKKEKTEYKFGKKVFKSGAKRKDDRSKFSVSFTKDREDRSTALHLDTLKKQLEELEEVWHALGATKSKPHFQMGFGYSVEVELFSGSIKGSWGFQEDKDNQVYFGYAFGFEITIFDGKLEISYGFEVSFQGRGILAKIFIAIKGTITLSGRVEKTSVASKEIVVPIKGVPEVETGLKVEVISEKLLNLVGKIYTGFEITGGGGVDDDGPYVNYDIKWEGVVGEFTITALNGMIEDSFTRPLFDEQDLKKGRWPAPKAIVGDA